MGCQGIKGADRSAVVCQSRGGEGVDCSGRKKQQKQQMQQQEQQMQQLLKLKAAEAAAAEEAEDTGGCFNRLKGDNLSLD